MLGLRLELVAHARAAADQDVESLRAVGFLNDVQDRVDPVLRLLMVTGHYKRQDGGVSIMGNERRVVRLIEVGALRDDPGTERRDLTVESFNELTELRVVHRRRVRANDDDFVRRLRTAKIVL